MIVEGHFQKLRMLKRLGTVSIISEAVSLKLGRSGNSHFKELGL